MASTKHKKRRSKGRSSSATSDTVLLYGYHAVFAALHNSERVIHDLYHSQPLSAEVESLMRQRALSGQYIGKEEMAAMLYPDSVHQGICAAVSPLPECAVEDFLPRWQQADRVVVIILDQVADARNLGAVLRSACCLGADAVLCTDRHSARESGHMAKTASGALEAIPLIRIGNLARVLQQLKAAGFWCYGFDGSADTQLSVLEWPKRSALLFGAESTGLRRLSLELCDALVKIPHNPAAHDYGVDSLNLAQSVSIALYAAGHAVYTE